MKTILTLLALISVLATSACTDNDDASSSVINELKQKHAGMFSFSPVSITEHEYQGETVYLVDKTLACCDLGATIYNQNGESICHMKGIVSFWSDGCSDFPENNRLVQTIYEYR